MEWQEEVIFLISEHDSNAMMLQRLFKGCWRVEWLQEDADVYRHLHVTYGICVLKGCEMSWSGSPGLMSSH